MAMETPVPSAVADPPAGPEKSVEREPVATSNDVVRCSTGEDPMDEKATGSELAWLVV